MRRRLGAFRADRRGTVTIQALIFSILLFGTTGLVLDSGRVYATHSQMQAFADQMALVAANELDGRDDAIQRAANAVFGFDGSLPFMHKAGLEVGAFTVARVEFHAAMAPSTRLQNDMTEAFPPAAALATASGAAPSYAGGDAAAASNAAAYAVVTVAEAAMGSALARIATPVTTYFAGGDQVFADTIPFGAVAAAGMERTTCADISTLVLCNPWEEISPSPLDVGKDEPGYSIPGRSLMYFAPNYSGLGLPALPVASGTAHGSLYPYDVANQLFRLTNPVADPAGLCSADYLMALASEQAGTEDAPDYMTARDRCLMARARSERVCWGPGAEFSVAPADGDMVSRALNTIFDNWMPPFREAIEADIPVGATGLTRAQFYEPDRLATTTFETADRHGPDPSDPQQDGIPDYGATFDGVPYKDTFQYLYDTVPMPGDTMLQRVHGLGIGHDICHANTYRKYEGGDATGACTNDFIGDYHEGGSVNASVTRSLLRNYFRYMYYQDPALLPAEVTTWYEMYRFERERFGTLATYDQNSRVVAWSDENAAMRGLADPAEKHVKHGPDEYLHRSAHGTLLNPGYERRRLRSALVNCAATVAQGADQAGHYPVATDDVRVVDVYLPAPPGHYCGPDRIGCALEDSIETRLYVELIEDVTDDASLQRYVAQLVR